MGGYVIRARAGGVLMLCLLSNDNHVAGFHVAVAGLDHFALAADSLRTLVYTAGGC